MTLPPLSLYIHFPWCIRKCPYCDFNSHTLKDELAEKRYVDALVSDFDSDARFAGEQRKLVSIFMGGGTPSLFSADSLNALLNQLRQRIDFESDIEITLEANPGSLEHDQFNAYREAGINRLSLGIQSFDDKQLKILGRIHDSDSAGSAIDAARLAGFENFNLDLMYGLPGQSIEMAVEDCRQAISYSPAHLSLYQLTIEPNTYFYRHPPALPDDDQQLEIQKTLKVLLEQAGYQQYEVSAYSLPNHECRHNLNYWQFGDYLGIGAGAHSKITHDGKVVRSWKQKHPESYMTNIEQKNPVVTENQVPESELIFEFMMNALRLKNGIDLGTFEQRTGITRLNAKKCLTSSIEKGLVLITGGNIRCSNMGYLFIDEILQDLLPEPS